jgi:hypothetical protein
VADCVNLTWLSNSMKTLCLSAEYKHLEQILGSHTAGDTALFGHSAFSLLLSAPTISNRFLFTQEIVPATYPKIHTCTINTDEPPLLENTFDLLVLPHTLETTEHYSERLDALVTLLKPEGKLILFGFNPMGPLNWKLGARPRSFNLHSATEVKTALRQCSCDISVVKHFLFSLGNPKQSTLASNTLKEKFGNLLFPSFSCLYMIVAKKKVVSMTPLKSKWSLAKTAKTRRAIPCRSEAKENTP